MTAFTFLAPAASVLSLLYFKLLGHPTDPSSIVMSDPGSIHGASSIFDSASVDPYEPPSKTSPSNSLSLQILHDGIIVLVLDHPGNSKYPWSIAADPKTVLADRPVLFHPVDMPMTTGPTLSASPTVKYAGDNLKPLTVPSTPLSSTTLVFTDSDVRPSPAPSSSSAKVFAAEENFAEDTASYIPVENASSCVFCFALVIGIFLLSVSALITSKAWNSSLAGRSTHFTPLKNSHGVQLLIHQASPQELALDVTGPCPLSNYGEPERHRTRKNTHSHGVQLFIHQASPQGLAFDVTGPFPLSSYGESERHRTRKNTHSHGVQLFIHQASPQGLAFDVTGPCPLSNYGEPERHNTRKNTYSQGVQLLIHQGSPQELALDVTGSCPLISYGEPERRIRKNTQSTEEDGTMDDRDRVDDSETRVPEEPKDPRGSSVSHQVMMFNVISEKIWQAWYPACVQNIKSIS